MHALEIDDVARTCLMNCVRTRDAQWQWARTSLRRNPPDVGVTSGQKPCTKIIKIYIVLQTSVGLF